MTHVHGDILTADPPEEKYNAMISVLTVLHIPDRAKLWKSVHDHLVKGAPIYVEDFYLRQPLSDQHKAALKTIVACPYLPSKDEYKKQLEDASFEDVKFEVRGGRWTLLLDLSPLCRRRCIAVSSFAPSRFLFFQFFKKLTI